MSSHLQMLPMKERGKTLEVFNSIKHGISGAGNLEEIHTLLCTPPLLVIFHDSSGA